VCVSEREREREKERKRKRKRKRQAGSGRAHLQHGGEGVGVDLLVPHERVGREAAAVYEHKRARFGYDAQVALDAVLDDVVDVRQQLVELLRSAAQNYTRTALVTYLHHTCATTCTWD
jgi:hypothetical protein